jgi:4-hydroxy-3-methylbut-2-en-1-yl diphosphate synthase IspG/GcpE
VVELADQLDRTIERMDSAVPMVTDIHHAPAERALTVEDIKFPESEIRILGPGIRHPAHLHPVARFIDVAAR